MERKYNEMIIISDTKPIYVILLEDRRKNQSSRTSYIKMYNGEIVFRDVAHRLAKETFSLQLKACIREKINDLKILEEVFREIGQEDHITPFIDGEYIQEIKQLDYKY